MKNLTISILLVLFSALSYAQNITGFILDKTNKEPLEAVVIKKVNSTDYTVSTATGKFTINAEINEEATVSLLGYQTKTINLKNGMVILLQEEPISLENIVIKTENISQATIISNAETRLTQPRNVADMFSDIPGFALIKRSTYAIDPVLRSFSEEQLNIQYDGGMKTTNACPNRMDPITTHISPEEIEKIEIIRGPFAVRFGSNFGGVINLQSKSAASYKEGAHGMLETGFESNGGSFIGRGAFIYKLKKFDFNTDLEFRDYGNYKDGNNTEVPASFKALDLSIKTGYNPTKNQRLQLTWRQTFAKDIKHAGLPMDSPKDDSYLIGFDYSYKNVSKSIKNIKTKLYYSYVDHIMDNYDRPSFMRIATNTPVESTMYGGKLEVNIRPSEKVSIFTGIDVENKSRDGQKNLEIKRNMMGNPINPHIFKTMDVWQEGYISDFGVYANFNFSLKNNFKILTGIRSDFVKADVKKPNEMFEMLLGEPIKNKNETNISGFLTFKKHLNNGEYQFSFGSGTRTANMTERYVYRFTLGNDPYELIGNPDLKPERNNQLEFSFSKNFEQVKIGANIFYSFINNMIISKIDTTTASTGMSMMPYVKRFINIDKATQYGGEFFINYNITERWIAHADVSYVRGENESWKEPLAQIAPLRSHIHLKYINSDFWIQTEAKFVSKQDKISPQSGEQKTPAYNMYNLKVGYNINDKFHLGASVLSMFDRAYAEHLNYSYKNSNINNGRVLEMGRNFTAQVTYKF